MKKAKVARFLISKEFHRNVGIAFAISILLLIVVFGSLRIYTHHGESFYVPDLKGLNLSEVEEIIESNDLRFQVTDSVYLQNFEPGTVVNQIPKANFKVKENRRIFLTINATTPEMLQMPNIKGRSLREAGVILESTGLVIGKLIYKPDIANDYVLEQYFNDKNIKPGESLPKGSVIDLVLGGGLGDKQTDVPNLIGVGWAVAKDTTLNKVLNLSAPIFDNSVLTKQDSLDAKIYKQDPAPIKSAKIHLGDYINVWLTIDTIKIEEALVQIEKTNYRSKN